MALSERELLLSFQCAQLFGKRFDFDMHENPKAVLAKNRSSPRIRCLVVRTLRSFDGLMLASAPIVLVENSYAANYLWAQRTSGILNYTIVDSVRRTGRPGSVDYIGAVQPQPTITLQALRKLKCVSMIWDRASLCFVRIVDFIRTSSRMWDVAGVSNPVVLTCPKAGASMLNNPEEIERVTRDGVGAVRWRSNWASQVRHFTRLYDQVVSP